MSTDLTGRKDKLITYFNQVGRGKRTITSNGDAKRFFEAIVIQEAPSASIERLVTFPHGLDALKKGARMDISSTFINNTLTPFLLYLADHSVKDLCGGQHLQRILSTISDPPTLIQELARLLEGHFISEESVHAFAWLIWELINLPTIYNIDPCVLGYAQSFTEKDLFTNADSLPARHLGQQIRGFLRLRDSKPSQGSAFQPGGRHDNDHADFRAISVLPTGDELASTKEAFYRRSSEVLQEPFEVRPAMHLDNQFRLLREDMLGELRLDLKAVQGDVKVKRRIFIIDGLVLCGIHFGDTTRTPRRSMAALRFCCTKDIPRLKAHKTVQDRKQYIKEQHSFLRHDSYGVLIHMGSSEVLSFATVNRDEDLLAEMPPSLVLQTTDPTSIKKTLLASKSKDSSKMKFVLLDTPLFAYQPILERLQDKTEFMMPSELLSDKLSQAVKASCLGLGAIVSEIEQKGGQKLDRILKLPKRVDLDPSQTQSLIAGLTQSLSLIQGPPGTGKSFIGALLAKAIHDYTDEKILVMCYTNHALDQFLEDLLEIGIPEESLVRLGSKSTLKTSRLLLSRTPMSQRLKSSDWEVINDYKGELEEGQSILQQSVDQLLNLNISLNHIMSYLEFSEDYVRYHEAFTVDTLSDDGMERVGPGGKKLRDDYLIERWSRGEDAGMFKADIIEDHLDVWKMEKKARKALQSRWEAAITEEEAAAIPDRMQTFNARVKLMRDVFKQGDRDLLQKKRVIGCTTTGASMYVSQLDSLRPGVLLVEEAGEILESHILAASSTHMKQVILIGDHKQLRPKINNYSLTVEKGDGYDLNRSLFERLVLGDYPHQTLQNQHRMPPQVSEIVKHLTYPELQDAPAVLDRPPLRGFQDRVVFFNHDKPETGLEGIADRRDEASKSSKQNEHEVTITLSCLRYLAQQGYGTDKVTVLTPYLGQLFLLKNRLSKDNDPVLNDLDSFDLVRAGLMTPAGAKHSKGTLKISTVDNYQGEESDIIIVSLTRSNTKGDIGFLISPERLNVLLSRSRIGLIMIGNMSTFAESRRGRDTWKPFLDFMKEKGHLYDGLPVQCERHPDRKALLREKEDFDRFCPDGGCSEPCGATVSCGVHLCPSRCHQIEDHSRTPCCTIIEMNCKKSHKVKIMCQDKPTYTCAKCRQEAKEEARKLNRDLDLDQQRIEKQRQHAQKLAELQDKINYMKRLAQQRREDDEMEKAVSQKLQDLQAMRQNEQNWMSTITNALTFLSPVTKESPPSKSPVKTNKSTTEAKTTNPQLTKPTRSTPLRSAAQAEWIRMKQFEGESNDALDELMQMIGLETIKEQFLDIKSKIDTEVRRGVDLRDERFSATLLGNPGTGKTTVARLYAKFLTSVGALSGGSMKEFSGSGLASDGINGCKKAIEDILNSGGGAMFIDEAYQLASGDHTGGKAVLDFLLAEVENRRGKIVFILAGYSKQMEKFFEHNQGFQSRFPKTMNFEDYKDEELLDIFNLRLNKKYRSKMKIEDGPQGLFARILARRIGRGRGNEGFGNAREVENRVSQVIDRQVKRLKDERRAGWKPDEMLLTSGDLIGPRPSNALQNNSAWQRLQDMIGLMAVKESLAALFNSIEQNYQRELEEKPPIQFNLNRVFLGNPGTGKTTIAKIYGQILAEIGLLSNGEVIVKTPSDFIGNVLGATESQTKAILASTVGKVLVIDEAYSFHAPGKGNANLYTSAAIDVIVGEIQSTPGQDRCVLLLGYEKQMEEMLQEANPGLARRFPLASAFKFEDFTTDELHQILDLKLKEEGFQASGQAKSVALDVLDRSRNRPNFGNAGEVDNLLNQAKIEHQKRMVNSKSTYDDVLLPQDFDKEFKRADSADTNIRGLFADVIGCDEIVSQLEGYQQTVKNMRARNMDPTEQIPFNFLFRGPPGTGKTSTARKMGKFFYDIGFLSTAKVEECSATDLVGEYIGHTGPKTRKLFEKALGRVLFIDEAYRLAEGQFSTEAMDEIVDCLTKPEFHKKLVVILAGYDEDINRLMTKNPGLTSRFPDTVTFSNLSPQDCLNILLNLLKKKEDHLDLSVLEHSSRDFRKMILEKFRTLATTPNWANARDVQHLGKLVFGKLMRLPSVYSSKIVLSEAVVVGELDNMIQERSHRAAASQERHTFVRAVSRDSLPKLAPPFNPILPLTAESVPTVSNDITTARMTTSTQTTNDGKDDGDLRTVTDPMASEPSSEHRDSGVDDETWEMLEHAKEDAQRQRQAYEALLAEESQTEKRIQDIAKVELQIAQERTTAEALLRQAIESRKDQEAKRRAEEQRIQAEKRRIEAELQRRAYEQQQRELQERRRKAEEEKRKDREAQAKLQTLGICPQGYRWIKAGGGYRCSAGGHFVSEAQLQSGSRF